MIIYIVPHYLYTAVAIDLIVLFLTKINSMKRFLIFVILIFTGSVILSQSFDRSYLRNDVLISYGIPSTDLFLKISSPMLNEQFPDERYVRDNYGGSGIVMLTYRRVSKSEKFFWGVTAGYNSTKGDLYYLGSHEGELKRNFITVAAEGHYRYQNLKKIQLYSGIGIGYSIGSETLQPPTDSGKLSASGSINRLAYQLNVIGIRMGSNIAGFIELGYGYKGIINAGLSIQIY